MEEIDECLHLLYRVSMSNKHILSPLQKDIDSYLYRVLGNDFKQQKRYIMEDTNDKSKN